MAGLIKTSVIKIIGPSHGGKISACTFIQQRNIMGRTLRESLPPPPPKPKPFDYVNKDYRWFTSLYDRTTHRFDENSKVIVVEGPVACGKTRFAACLAEDLGMRHFPEANMDFHYIHNKVDLRTLNELIPESTRTFDHCDFNLNPKHTLAGNYQIMMYISRYSQYIDALAHLLNTGQGVVLERSPYSDFVFLEAMYSQKYISKGVRSVYYELRHNTLEELMRPHLVIYMDLPVDKVVAAIKCRDVSYEVKGQALTPDYLTHMEFQYKSRYLRDIATHAELLVYDWTEGSEVEVVVEDIERIDFNKYQVRDEPKLKDWRLPREVDWADQRMLYTNQKHYLMNLFNVPRLDVPELLTPAEDAYNRDQIVYSHPSLRYIHGYDAKNVFLKSNVQKYETQH